MPQGGIFRAGRWTDVEKYPPPARSVNMGQPLLDGYRWEDAAGRFATVKCSGSPEAAIGRTIARYRPRLVDDEGRGIIDAIKGFLSGPPDSGDPDLTDGRVPNDVFDDLYLVEIPHRADALFVDLTAAETLTVLSDSLGPTLSALGLDFPGQDLARHPDRRATRLVVTFLQSLYAGGGAEKVAGIRYPGHPDSQWEAFVVWSEPEHISLAADDVGFRWVARWDEDLLAAAEAIGIKVPSDGG